MFENKPKIIAESVEEFNRIEAEINKLPESVRYQIRTAETGLMGIECEILNSFGDTTLYLPATTQITEFGDYIGVYAHNYFFKIPIMMKKYKITYVFVNELNRENK